MTNTTEIRIVKRFPDGQTGDVAVGTINRSGVITIERTAPGAEDSIAQVVQEMNATDVVYDKRIAIRDSNDTAQDEDSPGLSPLVEPNMQTTLVKQAFNRGTPEFFPALINTAKRFYGLELQFDEKILIEMIQQNSAAAAAAKEAEEAVKAAAMEAEDAALEARIQEAKARAAELADDGSEEAEDADR